MKVPSTQDKETTVNAFINGRLNKVAKVTDYSPMVPYLNGKLIEVLWDKLPQTSSVGTGKYGRTDGGTVYEIAKPWYGMYDAKMYLDWLISVVQGYTQATDEIKNKAYDQLCEFILILTDVTDWKDGYVLAKPYDWMGRLEQFEIDISNRLEQQLKENLAVLNRQKDEIQYFATKVDDLKTAIDEEIVTLNKSNEKHMSDIAKMLELITAWMEKYAPVMDRIQQDYKRLSPTKVRKQ